MAGPASVSGTIGPGNPSLSEDPKTWIPQSIWGMTKFEAADRGKRYNYSIFFVQNHHSFWLTSASPGKELLATDSKPD